MRSSLIISFVVHVLVSLIAINWVSFREVKFVPRQVYAVEIVTPTEVPRKKTESPPPEKKAEPMPEPELEPEPEPEPEEEMPPPPEKPKPVKKKEPKKPRREVPTTQLEKTLPKEETEPDQTTAAPETGEMAFDTDDFPFAHYIGRMRRKIAAHWKVPEGSQGEDRFCVIYFRVHRNGSVSHTAVEQSSGLFIFDQAAQRAVVTSAPMPPLPQAYDDEYLGVHFSFSYSEER
ncbi:MAG: TonB C-terminal domain-containing protein [Candidatus Latescibacterota bacterium]